MAEENQHIILATTDNDERKIIRREVEKGGQTCLFYVHLSALHSLLNSSRESVRHQITSEAVNYIQILKQKINALQVKRDRLKLMVNSSLFETGIDHPEHSGAVVKCVNINLIPGGVEIAICSGLEEGSNLPLSEFMEILLQEGCDVVSCVSTHANGRIFIQLSSRYLAS